jgi:hypothetical protein
MMMQKELFQRDRLGSWQKVLAQNRKPWDDWRNVYWNLLQEHGSDRDSRLLCGPVSELDA